MGMVWEAYGKGVPVLGGPLGQAAMAISRSFCHRGSILQQAPCCLPEGELGKIWSTPCTKVHSAFSWILSFCLWNGVILFLQSILYSERWDRMIMNDIWIAPETSIAPENQLLEDVVFVWDGPFAGAMLASRRVSIMWYTQSSLPIH